jgi:hypothetical protein
MNETTTTPEASESPLVAEESTVEEELLQSQAEYSRKTSELMVGYKDKLDEIKDINTVEGPYADHLSGEQRFQVITEKTSRHTANLQAKLFNVKDDSTAVAQAAAADEQGLLQMIELGQLVGDKNVACAAFAASVIKGEGRCTSRHPSLPRCAPGSSGPLGRVPASALKGLGRAAALQPPKDPPAAHGRPASLLYQRGDVEILCSFASEQEQEG